MALEQLQRALQTEYGLHLSLDGLRTVHTELKSPLTGVQFGSGGSSGSSGGSGKVLSSKDIWEHVRDRTLKGIAEQLQQ